MEGIGDELRRRREDLDLEEEMEEAGFRFADEERDENPMEERDENPMFELEESESDQSSESGHSSEEESESESGYSTEEELEDLSPEELLELWVRKVGNPVEIYDILRKTGSYISGSGLYSLWFSNITGEPIRFYASEEGAKLLLLSIGGKFDVTQFYKSSDEWRFYLKNGIGLEIRGRDYLIYVCRNPMESIQALPINHFQAYFDGAEIHPEVFDEALALNDSCVEDYLSFNRFINDQIQYCISRREEVAVNILPRHVGRRLAGPLPTDILYEILSSVHYDIVEEIGEMSPLQYAFFCIDSFLLDFSFDEMTERLDRVKKSFLPEDYRGEVRNLIAVHLSRIYDSTKDLPGYEAVFQELTQEYYGVQPEELPVFPISPSSQLHLNEMEIHRLKQIAEFKNKYDALVNIREKTRRLRHLEYFTQPSDKPTEELDYDEVKEDKCMDMESLSFYNINAYLNGEAVMAYSEEDEKGDREPIEDYALPPAPPEIARKRLVFFVASDERLTVVKPYCYHLDQLESAISTSLYSDTCTDRSFGYERINEGFSNPLFKIPLETNVYVRLSELLKGLYSTQSQAFLLIPTREVSRRTASLSTYLYQLGVSGDHCQEGTEKRVYKIVVCGKGTDKCYPLRGDIQFRPDGSVPVRVDISDYSEFIKRYDEQEKISRLQQDNMFLQDEQEED